MDIERDIDIEKNAHIDSLRGGLFRYRSELYMNI
jgi:hypothetical protein